VRPSWMGAGGDASGRRQSVDRGTSRPSPVDKTRDRFRARVMASRFPSASRLCRDCPVAWAAPKSPPGQQNCLTGRDTSRVRLPAGYALGASRAPTTSAPVRHRNGAKIRDYTLPPPHSEITTPGGSEIRDENRPSRRLPHVVGATSSNRHRTPRRIRTTAAGQARRWTVAATKLRSPISNLLGTMRWCPWRRGGPSSSH